MMRKTLTAALGLTAAFAALGAAGAASAQSYGGYTDGRGYYQDQGGYAYDPCRRDTTQRGTTGGLTGAALGAVIGGSAAAGGAKTEGAVLGGVVGAIAGAVIGKNSAACAPGQTAYAPARPSYSSGGYYATPRTAYYAPRYRPRYDSGYGRDYYDRYQDSYAVGEPVNRDGAVAEDCTMAESPIYMPDGSTEKRFVRVCRGADGRYAPVQ